MADSRMRSLERRWKATGNPEEAVSYFRALVRAGNLAPDRLELAAYLGDEAASLALEEEVVRPPSVHALVRILARWGHEPLIRTLLVAARWNLPKWEAVQPRDGRPHMAIQATEAWLRCPCDEHAASAELAASAAELARIELKEALRAYLRDPLERRLLHRAIEPVAESASRAAELAAQGARTDLRLTADTAVRSVEECLAAKGMFLRSLELQMREAIARELIPWALRPVRSAG